MQEMLNLVWNMPAVDLGQCALIGGTILFLAYESIIEIQYRRNRRFFK